MMAVFNPPDVTKKEDSYWYDPVVYCKKMKETQDKQIRDLKEEIKNLLKENESIKKDMPFKETIIL